MQSAQYFAELIQMAKSYFGSRTDDSRRGGDIDIYCETEKRLTLDDEIRVDIEIEEACDTKGHLE